MYSTYILLVHLQSVSVYLLGERLTHWLLATDFAVRVLYNVRIQNVNASPLLAVHTKSRFAVVLVGALHHTHNKRSSMLKRLASSKVILICLYYLTCTASLTLSIPNTMSTPKIKLSYFDIEGAAEKVRLALVLSKTDFEDDRVGFADWPTVKTTTPVGSLPVMTVNDGPMRTESGAMLRWVGATFSETLYPRDKLLDIEEAMGVVDDLSRDLMPAIYSAMRPIEFGHPEDLGKTEEGKVLIRKLRERFVAEKLPVRLRRMETLMKAHGGKWLVAGDEPTIADCAAVPVLRGFTRGHMDYIDTNCLNDFPTIVAYIKNFCALEGVQGRYKDGIN